MSLFRNGKVGVYGPKTRDLQKRLSFEKTTLTFHPVKIWKYLGSRTNLIPNIHDIGDLIFLETPDKAYAANPIEVNSWLEFLPESQFDLSKFGIINPLGNSMQFRMHISSFETDGLGRFPMASDVIEVPFWKEGNTTAFFEITDVDKKAMFENFFVIVTAVPMKDTQETTEIPNVVSDNDNLNALDVSFETSMEAIFKESGVNFEDSLYSVRDYVADDYYDGFNDIIYADEEIPRDPYDVRKPNAADFLDDPLAKPF